MDNKIKFKKGYTFDDVLLVPQRSKILPKDTILKTRLTNDIKLNIPIMSAAMDTVTEEDMAIAMAREGGIGVIHKNCSIESQKYMVDKVKRSESGMILKPVTVRPDQNIQDARNIMSEFRISGLPVVKDDKLVGIITNRDIRFQIDGNLEVSSCMTSDNLITVPLDTSLEDAEKLLHEHRIEKLLVVNESGDLAGLITVKDIKKKQQYPHACKDRNGRLRVAAAVGVAGDTAERVKELVNAEVDVIVVDTAHGHSRGVLDTISQLKNQNPNTELIEDHKAPAMAKSEITVSGGIRTLENYQKCPAWAFYENRLHATSFQEDNQDEVSKRSRGNLIHELLENFWRKHKNSINLANMSDKVLVQNIEKLTCEVIANYKKNKPHLTTNQIKLEEEFYKDLLYQWLTYEKTKRPKFTVVECEKKYKIKIDRITFNVIIDRIDEYEDGSRLIIDYKTGIQKPISHWSKDPITSLQMPIYISYANIKDISAAGIGYIHNNNINVRHT